MEECPTKKPASRKRVSRDRNCTQTEFKSAEVRRSDGAFDRLRLATTRAGSRRWATRFRTAFRLASSSAEQRAKSFTAARLAATWLATRITRWFRAANWFGRRAANWLGCRAANWFGCRAADRLARRRTRILAAASPEAFEKASVGARPCQCDRRSDRYRKETHFDTLHDLLSPESMATIRATLGVPTFYNERSAKFQLPPPHFNDKGLWEM